MTSFFQSPVDDAGTTYVTLVRQLYQLANSCQSPDALYDNLLRALFLSLSDDTLLFLAGIWTDPSAVPRQAALKHALAFLLAQKDAAVETPVDFQVILPALLLTLRSENRAIRASGMECINMLKVINGEKRSAVYAVETIYGERTCTYCPSRLDEH